MPTAYRASINEEWLKLATFVSVPPSKAKSDLLYGDRMTRVPNAINPQQPVDCRALIVQTHNTLAVHELDDRLVPAGICEAYALD